MIDLSVHIERMKDHIEADELVRGLGFAAAFAQATKKGRPRQECSPRRSTLYCLPKLVAGVPQAKECASTQSHLMHCGTVLQVLFSNLRCYRARAFAIT